MPDHKKSLVQQNPCKNHHQYYLMLRVLQLHLEDAIEQGSTSETEKTRSAFIQLLQSSQCDVMANQSLNIELFRRDALLEHGSEEVQKKLWSDMTEILSKGDTNWSTALTAIKAAVKVECAKKESSEEKSPSEMLEGTRVILEQLAGSDKDSSKADRGYTLGLLELSKQTDGRIGGPVPGKPKRSTRLYPLRQLKTLIHYRHGLSLLPSILR